MQFKHQYKNPKNEIKDEWSTPDYIFDPLNKVFSFTLDAAATPDNAKVGRFYANAGPRDNGLVNSWKGERVFCNPPYTEGQYKSWIQKSAQEVANKTSIVLLLPGSWETEAYVPVWAFAKYLIFPYKRIKFEHPDIEYSSAPFSSLIPVFTKATLTDRQIRILDEIGRVIDLHKGLLNDNVNTLHVTA